MRGYLKIPGIPGDVVDAKHAGWIALSRFTNSIENRPGSGLSYGTLSIEKAMDPATPALAQAVLEAKSFDEIVIEFNPEDVVDRTMTLRFLGARIEAQTLGTADHPLRESLTVRFSGFQYDCTGGKNALPKKRATARAR